jgi:hypothetical protein
MVSQNRRQRSLCRTNSRYTQTAQISRSQPTVGASAMASSFGMRSSARADKARFAAEASPSIRGASFEDARHTGQAENSGSSVGERTITALLPCFAARNGVKPA